MPQALRLELTASQRTELERVRDTYPKPYLRERAAALLKIADGQSGLYVARYGLLKPRWPDTIYEWVKRYQAAGLAGLLIQPGRGRKPAYAPQHAEAASAQAALLHVVRRDPRQFGEERNRWTLDSLRRVCAWLRLRTAAGLSQLLRRLKIHYKRGRAHIHSPDADYLPKLRTVQVCVRRSQVDPDLVVVLFQDEFTYYRQPTLASAYEAAGPSQPLAQWSYQRDSLWRVVATLDVLTGRVVYTQAPRIRIPTLVAFYAQVRAAYPHAQTIYLVQDNWPVHYHPDVLAALQPQRLPWPVHVPANWPTTPSPTAQRLNLPITLIQLPTYASWTNPIEKLWRKLRQEELHLHRLAADWSALKQRVAAFLDQFASGSRELLRYVGLSDLGRLYHSAFAHSDVAYPLRC